MGRVPGARLTPLDRGALGGGIGFAVAILALPFFLPLAFSSDSDSVTTAGTTVVFALYGAVAGCGLAAAFPGPTRRVAMVLQAALAFGGATLLGTVSYDAIGIGAYPLAGVIIGLVVGIGRAARAAAGAVVGSVGLCLVVALTSPFDGLAAFGVMLVTAGMWGATMGAVVGWWGPTSSRGISWEAVWRTATRPVVVAAAVAVLLPVQLGAAILGPLRKPPRFCFTERALPPGAIPAATADFDGDGDVDAVQRVAPDSRLGLLRNDGGGAVQASFQVPGLPRFGLAAGDVDRDGDADVAAIVVDRTKPTPDDYVWTVVIARNGGDGEFSPVPGVPVPPDTRDVATGDVDGDGAVDVVVSDRTGLRVLWSRADGLEPGPRLQTGPSWWTVADLDGDRRADLLTVGMAANLVFHRSTGAGFEPGVVIREGFVSDVAVADLDADGDLDLALAGPADVHLLTNLGGGRWAPAEVLRGTAQWLDLVDLDGDDDFDLVASSSPGGEDDETGDIRAWANDGAAGWSAAGRIATTIERPLVFDFTGDGRADLVTGYGSRWKLLAATDC